MSQDHTFAIEGTEPLSNNDSRVAGKPPRVWTIWVTLLAIAVVMMVAQIVMVAGIFVYFALNGKDVKEIEALLPGAMTTPQFIILSLFCGPGLFGLGAFVAARFSPEPWRERLGLVPVRVSRAIYPLAMFGSLFLAAVSFGLAGLVAELLPEALIDKSVAELYEKLTPLWSIPFVILIGLIPGFCEEMLFRGYVQRRLISRWRPFWGITLSSILFGLAHVMPLTVVFATVIGFYLGVLAWKCGSIWPSILCHLFINSAINLWRTMVKFQEIPEQTQNLCEGIGLGISAICFAATLWLLFRKQNATATSELAS